MRRVLTVFQALALCAAGAVWLVPLPAPAVERYYADGFYPRLQATLTSWSNTTGYALFDVLVAVAALLLVVAWLRWTRTAWRARSVRPVVRGAALTLTAAAVAYLWFAIAWGINYSRLPLETAIGYDAARVTPRALDTLARRAVDEVNRRYAAAHAAGFPETWDVPPALVTALHATEKRLGRPRPTTPGRPKRTAFAPFFRAAGVDGMHAPFLLETLVNPWLTPAERPAVLAHEWAHLSGYAPEDDASFVGLVAALGADPASQYSAWLAIFDLAVGQLPRNDQRVRVAALGPGPQADRRAIAIRLATRVDVVANASWKTYDQYLKSQGVEEGVASYSRVVQLLLGSNAVDWR